MKRKTKVDGFELKRVCPWCGKTNDAVCNAEQHDVHPPSPGSITLGFCCGEWSVFQHDLSLRKPTDDELIEIAQDRYAQDVRKAWVMAQAEYLTGKLFRSKEEFYDFARTIDSPERDLHAVRGEERAMRDELRALLRGLRREAQR